MNGIHEAMGRIADWSEDDSHHRVLMIVHDLKQTRVVKNNFTAQLLSGIMKQSPTLYTLISDAMKIYNRRNKQERITEEKI